MLARIEQVTTTPEGALAAFATYREGQLVVNSQRHSLMMPMKSLYIYRNANGLRERLDGVEVADNPTFVDALLAEQIGFKTIVVEVTGEIIAERLILAVMSFANAHYRARVLLAQVESATDEQLTAMAAGRKEWLTQLAQVAEANLDEQTRTHALERMALAELAESDPTIARQLAYLELEPQHNLLLRETPWPTGNPDPYGFLRPEVLALVGTEWEC